MIQAIAFDLDNTLLDFRYFKDVTSLAAAKAMVSQGLKGSVDSVNKEIWDIYDEYGVEYQKTFSTLLWDKHEIRDMNTFERIQQAGITAYLKSKLRNLRPYKDVPLTLKTLLTQQYHLFILTDAPRNKAWQRLVITGLDSFFQTNNVITYEDTLAHKPDPKPYRELLNRAKVCAEKVLFIGDNPERDIKGAKQVGMKTALADYGWILSRDSKVEPDYHLNTFSEILTYLKS